MSVEVEMEPKVEEHPESTQPTDADSVQGTEESSGPSYTGFLGKVDTFFGITERGSTFKTESVAGITTFMAMVYILMVNAGFFAGYITYGAAYIATAIGAVVGTLLMALYARMPLAMATGMGTNAYIAFTLLTKGDGLTFANTMVFVLLDGVIFLILTVTGLREKIFNAIPSAVKTAIPVGIGMFIAFIGFQQASVIVGSGTLVTFRSFNSLGDDHFITYSPVDKTVGGMLPALIAIFGVVAIAVLNKLNVRGAILWGILGSTVMYYIVLGICAAASNDTANEIFKGIDIENPGTSFANWGEKAVAVVFYKGFDFSKFNENAGQLVLLFFTTALSLCMIDMFDTIGTLYGACSKGNLLDENGVPIKMNQMMLSDAIATCTGAVAGTCTVTTFVESSSGVSVGGRTGFTALITALCFFIAMFLSPIASLVPRCATATALIWVGVLMMTSVVKIDWEDPADAIVAFMTFIIMCLGYSISTGIGGGIICYIVVSLCTGKVRAISIPTWVIGLLFVATFALTD